MDGTGTEPGTELKIQNQTNNNEIETASIKVRKLEKKYDILLKQYQESLNNYISIMQTNSANPCNSYSASSIGLSQDCIDKIWSDQKCTAPDMIQSSSVSSQTLDDIVQTAFTTATSTDTTDRQNCYGTSTTYSTATAPVYPNQVEFTTLPERAWWGTGSSATSGPATSDSECQGMCSADPTCSGATFNSGKQYCWTRTGEAPLNPAESGDFAILSTEKAALLTMQTINVQLINLNNEIAAELKIINPAVVNMTAEQNAKNSELLKNYTKLELQNAAIAEQLVEYESLKTGTDDTTVAVEQQNMTLRFWALIAMILVVICIFQTAGAGAGIIGIVLAVILFAVLGT